MPHRIVERRYETTLRSFVGLLKRGVNGHRRRRVMVFGDSNACRPMNWGRCWPAMLQRISGGSLRVINESHDGRTTHFDTGERNGLAVFASALNRHRSVDGVIIALGTNDLKVQYGPPDTADVLEGMERLIDLVVKSGDGAMPVLLTPPPIGHARDAEFSGAPRRMSALMAGYRRLAAVRGIVLIDLQPSIDVAGDLEKDGVHLNVQGRKSVANTVWRCVARYFLPFDRSGLMGPGRE